MRHQLISIFFFSIVISFSGQANAGIFDKVKGTVADTAKGINLDTAKKAIGLNLPCPVSTENSDALTFCLKSSLTNAIVKDFGKVLSDEDLSAHQTSVMNTIFSGEDQAWENSSTGASGETKVVAEKTKTKKTKVVVLKDKVETVPPLDLIGENYQATSSINVRGGPGTDYKVVGNITSGDVVSVVGQVKEADWYLVSQGGVGSGFVFKSLLSPAATLDATHTEPPTGELAEVKTKTTQTCKTIEQIVTAEDGTEKTETIKACQGPNGWEIV